MRRLFIQMGHHLPMFQVGFGLSTRRASLERVGLDGFLIKPVTKSMAIDTLVRLYMESADQEAAATAATVDGVNLTGMRILPLTMFRAPTWDLFGTLVFPQLSLLCRTFSGD